MKYTYLHIVPDSLDSGRPLGFGDEVTLDKEAQDANARLIDEGYLVQNKQTKSPKEETE